jgi:hypothetical protein
MIIDSWVRGLLGSYEGSYDHRFVGSLDFRLV